MAGLLPEKSRRMVGALVAVVAIGSIVVVTRTADLQADPVDLPLAAPNEPETTTTLPPSRPVTPSNDWRLAVQTPGVLWEIDVTTGELTHLADAADSVPRGSGIVVMKPGGVDMTEQDGSTSTTAGGEGDILLMLPDGDELSFGAGLPLQRLPLSVGQSPRFAVTPRPVALVPVWDGVDMVLRRTALDGTSYGDVPLAGCGEAVPIAAMGTDRVFAVWCRDSDDLRLFYDSPSELLEVRFDEIRGDGLRPALLARGDKPILVDPFGGVWGILLAEPVFDDPERLVAGAEGVIELEDDERILGIAAITADFEHIVVGVSSGRDFDGSVTASRLAGYDPLGFTDGWSFAAPAPVVSLVGAPDGMVYGLGSDDDGGVLIVIEPETGAPKVKFRGLPVDEGRLMIMG